MEQKVTVLQREFPLLSVAQVEAELDMNGGCLSFTSALLHEYHDAVLAEVPLFSNVLPVCWAKNFVLILQLICHMLLSPAVLSPIRQCLSLSGSGASGNIGRMWP